MLTMMPSSQFQRILFSAIATFLAVTFATVQADATREKSHQEAEKASIIRSTSCEDDVNFHFKNKKRTCLTWVKLKPDERCQRNYKGQPIRSSCPLTCGECPDGGYESNMIDVGTYGALGDSIADDTGAIQSAIDEAEVLGSVVRFGPGVFRTSSPIVVPAGVKLLGQGMGQSPLAISFNGTVIAYCGTDWAVKFRGHSSGMQDMAVNDWRYTGCEGTQAAGGILLDAKEGRKLESLVFQNVLIYHFMGGTALKLHAGGHGAIAYCSFYDVRVRHAYRGIHFQAGNDAEDTAFVNSNQFFGGAVSGHIEDVAVLAEGPGPCNDQKIWGMVIEPPSTQNGHVVISGKNTNVKMHDTRLEGSKQNSTTPMLIIKDGSYGNFMEGIVGHTFVQADYNANPQVSFLSHKGVSHGSAPLNAFPNSAFHGSTTHDIPDWNIENKDACTVSVIRDVQKIIYPHHFIIKISNVSDTVKLSPKQPAWSMNYPNLHSMCSFGIYARASTPGAIVATMRHSLGGFLSSSGHTGSGQWEFIGSSAPFDQTSTWYPKFYIKGDVEVTAPVFHWGQINPLPGASLMSSSGAKMTGTLSMGSVTVTPYPPTVESDSPGYWILPKEGNTFFVDLSTTSEGVVMDRINHRTKDRFPPGTVITLLFPNVGITVRSSVYINLKGESSFSPTVPNTSLTLVNRDGIKWFEMSRNI